LSVEWTESEVLKVENSRCKRGQAYAQSEVFDPRRTLATTVLVDGGDIPLVSVRTDQPIPKGAMLDVMDHLAQVVVQAPIDIGDIIVPDVLGSGSNIVATKKIAKRA